MLAAPPPPAATDAERVRLFAIAEALDFPHLPYKPAYAVAGSRDGWETFTRTASGEDFALVLKALTALVADDTAEGGDT